MLRLAIIIVFGIHFGAFGSQSPPIMTATPTPHPPMSVNAAAEHALSFVPAFREPVISRLWLLPEVSPGLGRWCDPTPPIQGERLIYLAHITVSPAAREVSEEESLGFGEDVFRNPFGFALSFDARTGDPIASGSIWEACYPNLDELAKGIEWPGEAVSVSPIPAPATHVERSEAERFAGPPPRLRIAPIYIAGADPLDPSRVPSHLESALAAYPLLPGTSWGHRETCDDAMSSLGRMITTTVRASLVTRNGTLIAEIIEQRRRLQAPFPLEAYSCEDTTAHSRRRWILTDGTHFYRVDNAAEVPGLLYRIENAGLNPSRRPCAANASWGELFLIVPPLPGPWFGDCRTMEEYGYSNEAYEYLRVVDMQLRDGTRAECYELRWAWSSGASHIWFCPGIGEVRSTGTRGGLPWPSFFTELVEFRPAPQDPIDDRAP